MESLCYRHPLLLLGAAGIILVLCFTEVAGFGYLDSLSPSPSQSPSLSKLLDDFSITDLPTTTTKTKITTIGGGYLDSLQGQHPDGEATASSFVDVGAETTRVTEAETPDDHYAKDHPGAGWGGYKHPMFGGYLDNLSPSKERENTSTSYNDGTAAPVPTQQEVVPTQPVKARAGSRKESLTGVPFGQRKNYDAIFQEQQRSNTLVEKEKSKAAQKLSAVEKAEDSSEDDDNMSETQKLMKQVKEAGTAGVISYALWELGFWALSVPVCAVGYYQVTGHWPDLSNPEDQKKLGAEAFAFVNVARFAVPLRIGLALGTTPWIDENVVKRYRRKGKEEM